MNTISSVPVKRGQVLVHHIVLALPLREVHDRHALGPGEAGDVGDELLRHGRHQRGRGDRSPSVSGQEPHDLTGALQLRDEHVEVHPVDALDLEHDVIPEVTRFQGGSYRRMTRRSPRYPTATVAAWKKSAGVGYVSFQVIAIGRSP